MIFPTTFEGYKLSRVTTLFSNETHLMKRAKLAQKQEYTQEEKDLLDQAGIVAALVGVIGIIWPAMEVAEHGPTAARIMAIVLAIFAFLPFAAGVGIKMKNFGMKTVVSRWSILFVGSFGLGMVIFCLLWLVGHWFLAALIFIFALVTAYRCWPSKR